MNKCIVHLRACTRICIKHSFGRVFRFTHADINQAMKTEVNICFISLTSPFSLSLSLSLSLTLSYIIIFFYKPKTQLYLNPTIYVRIWHFIYIC